MYIVAPTYMSDFSLSSQVRCYDWDADSSNDLIGEFYTTLAELSDAASGSGKVNNYIIYLSGMLLCSTNAMTTIMKLCTRTHTACICMAQLEWEVINPAKQAKKKNYKNSGTVQMKSIQVIN